jgi:HAD superfamily hydrolase (TIGR01490 family)
MALALFDLDNTLLEGDSDYGWGEYMAQVGLVDAAVHRQRNQEFADDYRAGRLVMADYLAFQLAPLTRFPRETILAHRAEYVQTVIMPLIRPQGLEAIAQHRARGDTIIIITATNEFVTRPIAEALQVAHLIATQVEEIQGKWTGRSIGVPSLGEGKITRLQEWLASSNRTLHDEESWFYSDSINDLPLLSKVKHPVVVTPDPRLREHAIQQKWRIENWSFRSPSLSSVIYDSTIY